MEADNGLFGVVFEPCLWDLCRDRLWLALHCKMGERLRVLYSGDFVRGVADAQQSCRALLAP